MAFRNGPSLRDENNDGKVKRYVHQPLTSEHFGIQFQIKENGKIIISSAGTKIPGTNDIEFEQVEIPASLVFKLATLLKATRSVKYVTMAEAAALPIETEVE